MAEREHVILYVDDDPDYRLAVRQLLEANGLRMIEAADGEAGFRAFREHKPDLVIVDLMMEDKRQAGDAEHQHEERTDQARPLVDEAPSTQRSRCRRQLNVLVPTVL